MPFEIHTATARSVLDASRRAVVHVGSFLPSRVLSPPSTLSLSARWGFCSPSPSSHSFVHSQTLRRRPHARTHTRAHNKMHTRTDVFSFPFHHPVSLHMASPRSYATSRYRTHSPACYANHHLTQSSAQDRIPVTFSPKLTLACLVCALLVEIFARTWA
jgi:hypothetical protein